MIKDKDLISIQEVRNKVEISKLAQNEFKKFPQEEIDKIVRSMAMGVTQEIERLAKLAQEETGFGRWESKLEKNRLASTKVYDYIKDMKLVGILNEDTDKKVIEVGVPVGVIAGLVPSTNPTSTVIYKTLISVKSGNSIVFSPHPSAIRCIGETVKIMAKIAEDNGAPKGLIQYIENPSIPGTDALMKHKDVKLILATGGTPMVKAAYSSGTPALGVGPGNVPVFIERSADIKDAVKKIFASKTFDNGIICASEESIITERLIKDQVIEEIKRQGGYFASDEEADKIKALIDTPRGGLNPQIVGKDAQTVAKVAGITIPDNTKLILYEEKGVGPGYGFSKEKLSTLLGFYTVEDWVEACEISHQILNYDGLGHSIAIHSRDEDVIIKFGLEKEVSRVLVNTPSSQGAVGLTTNLAPSFTLGCGAVGGSATSDNVTPRNLINIRRIAYGVEDNTSKETCPVEDDQDSIDKDLIRKLIVEEISRFKSNK